MGHRYSTCYKVWDMHTLVGWEVAFNTTVLNPNPMWVFGSGHSIFQLSWRSYHSATTARFGGSCEREIRREGEEEKDEDGKKLHRYGQIPRRDVDRQTDRQAEPNKPEADR